MPHPVIRRSARSRALPPRTLRWLTSAAVLPLMLTSTACTIRSTRTVEHGAPGPHAATAARRGPVTLRLRDGSTVVFPDGVIVRADSVVARAPAVERSSRTRSVVDILTRGPQRIPSGPSTPRSSAGQRLAVGAARPEFVVGVVTDSVVAMQTTERPVNRPATVVANGAIALLLVVALAVSYIGESPQ